MDYSPLFWPIQLKRDVIYILDETLLPERLHFIKARTYKEAARAIKEMKTRAVGQVLLVMYAFLLIYKQNKNKNNFFELLAKAADAFNSARPTLSFRFLTDMLIYWQKNKLPLDKCISGFLEELKMKRIEQAREAASLIEDGDSILTHCNISGLMPLIGEFCRRDKKRVSFFVTETRPYLQGARLSAWELQQAGFPVTIIADNMVAQVMQEAKVNKVIVGADNLAQNGDIANKIGTYQIAILARHFRVPFYVVCPPASKAKSGNDICIEVRPDRELLEYRGLRLAPKGAKGYYPAFDITPAGLITKHINLRLK